MRSEVKIDDPDDPRIDVYRNVRDRDLAGRHRGLIAEGDVVLRALLGSLRHRPASLLISERRRERLADDLAGLDPSVPVYVAGQAVMDRIVGFHIHRGVLAYAERAEPISAKAVLGSLEGDATVIALFGVSNHDNVGGVFRNAAAFGAAAVLLDRACCDPLYRKAIRVSVGATLSTPFAWLEGGEDPLAQIASHGFEPWALSPRGAFDLDDLAPPRRVALLIGSEGHGLAEDVLTRARTVRIPMDDGFDSLNLASASGIALHHLRRRPAAPIRGKS